MSTPSRSLLTRLVDDAAVFPPGNSPVPLAWSEHLARRAGEFADLIGPLLIDTARATQLVTAAATHMLREPTHGQTGTEQVQVGVIARLGVAADEVTAAYEALRDSPHVNVASVELASDESNTWRHALNLDVPVAVELTGDQTAWSSTLDSVRAAADTSPHRILIKLRTQSIPGTPLPSAGKLADFIVAAHTNDLAMKLTGGLHHAVPTQTPAPGGGTETQHGLANVLLASHVVASGGTHQDLTDVLQIRDGQELARSLSSLGEDDVVKLRSRFASFGCCGVLDPIHDLRSLGLITPTTASTPTTATQEDTR